MTTQNTSGPGAVALEIAMQPVKSSNISHLGYHAPTKTLEVHFSSGSKYRYGDVPEGEFNKMLMAASVGGHFAAHIRNQYPGKRINAQPEPEPAPAPTHAELLHRAAWPFPTPRDH